MSSARLSKDEIIGVIEEYRDSLRALGVRRLGLFGSFVRGDEHDQSDVDLLVEFTPGQKTFRCFMELSFMLEDILLRRVEIVTLESLSPYIGPHILKEVEYVTIAA
ncbi:MAG: nucleotidyltransferase family protein [Candidatus Eisenbacteria sp.]|nr:nucleotidyltransferase family protein [Candidatus Eisenbacteria bacterium]